MIKKKTVFYSTETGKCYKTYDKAIEAEKNDVFADVEELVKLFNENLEAFRNEVDRIHEKYDPILDSLIERIHNLGFELCEADVDNEIDGEQTCSCSNSDKEDCPCVGTVKVRVHRIS